MMSRIPRPAIASSGSVQNGWIMLVQASPHATPMAVFAMSAFNPSAASIIIGPCTPYWPPPDGTNMFTSPPPMNAQKGSVSADEILKKEFAIV